MISVILLTHNYANYLSECLDSILENDISLIGEVIIINDYKCLVKIVNREVLKKLLISEINH